jgi:hypothetical protein
MQIELATAAATTVKASDVKDTVKLIEAAIKKQRMFLVQSGGEQNPQVVTERLRVQERVDMLEAILDSMKGKHIALRIYAQ